MIKDKKTKDFYKRLQLQLEENTNWPSLYLYKFIVPTDVGKIKKIETAFEALDAKISIRNSSKGTYTSVSIEVKMNNPKHVIEKYLEVSEIEGLISL